MNNIRKVVFIMTDTQRKDMVGCYGNKDMKTPNIDRLAREGIRFEKAYTAQPVCQPARAGLFTGMYPHSTGGWSNCMGLGEDVQTIGTRLRDQGIHTAYIGKWHLDGGDYFGMGRCPKGWDDKYWYDMRNYLEELTHDERIKSRKCETMEIEGISEDFTFGHRCTNRAIDFLEKYNQEDFFLVVSYDEPHGPSLAPEPYASLYKDYEMPKTPSFYDDLKGKPRHQKIWAGDKLHIDRESFKIKAPALLGCNSYIDYEIGRVLGAIEEYVPDALVIYTSDHGAFLSAHSLDGKGPAMYDEITNIPLIIKCSELKNRGSIDYYPVSHLDLAPTIFDMMGVPIPKMFAGDSLKEQLVSKKRVKDYIFMEFGRYETDHDGFGGFQPIRAVFDGRYKLVINLLSEDELYDLEKDPYELQNLIGMEEVKEVRNKLHNVLLEEMNRTRDPFRGYYWEERSWRTDCKEPTWDYTGMTRQKENEEYEPRQLDYATGIEITVAVQQKN